jgi:opacity protein-like surface antigen
MLAGILALGLALLASGQAFADGRNRGVPAPIPVPAPMPIPESFSYYLRADLGWGFVGSAPSYRENGRAFGGVGSAFPADIGEFSFGGAPFTSSSTSADDVFNGGIGFGAYLTPRLRADVTLDFRGTQGLDSTSTYTFVSGADTVNGTVTDTLKVSGTAMLVNAYWDILPRGSFSPYVGAGIGFVYNDIARTYFDTQATVAAPLVPSNVTGSSRENHLGLAAALTAGVTFASDHRFVWDLSYRALYMDGGNVTTTLSNGDPSTAAIGSQWEHQIRIGVRANIW